MNEQKKKKILEKADELSKASEIAISLSRIDGHIAACVNESLAIVTAASLNSYLEEVMPTIALSRIAQAVAMGALARQYIEILAQDAPDMADMLRSEVKRMTDKVYKDLENNSTTFKFDVSDVAKHKNN